MIGADGLQMDREIELVIPLHNEAPGIPHLFDQLNQLFTLAQERRNRIRVVLVDDGSTDETLELLFSETKEKEGFEVVSSPRCQGVGGAMKLGFSHCKGDRVVCYDADCTYPVEDILRLAEGLKEYDVVTASPILHRGDLRDVPWFRRWMTYSAALLYRVVLWPHSREVSLFTCAFRAYRGPVLPRVSPTSDGFPATAEILCRAVLLGYRVREVASPLRDRQYGSSKMNTLKAVRGHFQVLARTLGMRLFRTHRRQSPGMEPIE